MCDMHEQEISISVNDLTCAPDYIKKIINTEETDYKNKLISISGYSMCYPNGDIQYDVFDLAFSSSFTTLNIYKVTKWTDDRLPNINRVWTDKEKLKEYLRLMKGVRI